MIVVTGSLPRNTGRSFRRKKLIEINNMLKCKYSQIRNIVYLEPKSCWVKQSSELNIELCYKDELHFIEKGYTKLKQNTITI